jgi:hypothetical protein
VTAKHWLVTHSAAVQLAAAPSHRVAARIMQYSAAVQCRSGLGACATCQLAISRRANITHPSLLCDLALLHCTCTNTPRAHLELLQARNTRQPCSSQIYPHQSNIFEFMESSPSARSEQLQARITRQPCSLPAARLWPLRPRNHFARHSA